jgi:hypothetical protein
VDRRDSVRVLEALEAVLQGDPRGMAIIATFDHAELRGVASEVRQPALVARSGAVRVLRGLLEDAWTPEQAQAWASFVRRGYVAGRDLHAIRPLDIDYEDACEEEIAAAVSRLDEIGDLVDGEVSTGEILDLLQLLGEP